MAKPRRKRASRPRARELEPAHQKQRAEPGGDPCRGRDDRVDHDERDVHLGQVTGPQRHGQQPVRDAPDHERRAAEALEQRLREKCRDKRRIARGRQLAVHHEELQDVTAARGQDGVQTGAGKLGARHVTRAQGTRVRVGGAEDVEPPPCSHELRKLVQHYASDNPPEIHRDRPIDQQPKSPLRGIEERLDLVDHNLGPLCPNSNAIRASAGLTLIDIVYPAAADAAPVL